MNSTNSLPSRLCWFREANWGVMFHYLDKPASSTTVSSTSAEEWNRRVESFDVARFAATVKETGAGYVIFTLGQNTGHFCAPNPVYDGIVGIRPSKLSRRDLIMELAEALLPEVKLIAYLPSHAPAHDAQAVDRLRLHPSWDGSAWGLRAPLPAAAPADQRLAQFQRHWEDIITWWGERWGEKVAGWWLDGCYFPDKMYRDREEPNFASFARALRAGNGERILAFNSGTSRPFERLAAEQDYTAGETSNRMPAPNKWEPMGETIDGMQMHVLSYLGDWWGEGGPRFSTEWVRAYTRMVVERGGVMTWDVPIRADGEIPSGFLDQLQACR